LAMYILCSDEACSPFFHSLQASSLHRIYIANQ